MSPVNPKIYLFVTRHFLAGHRIDHGKAEFNGEFGFSETNHIVDFLTCFEENADRWPEETIQNIEDELYKKGGTEVETLLFLPILLKEEFTFLSKPIIDTLFDYFGIKVNILWIEDQFMRAIENDKRLPKVVVSSFADRLCSFVPGVKDSEISSLKDSHDDWLVSLFKFGVEYALKNQDTGEQILQNDLDFDSTWKNNYKYFQSASFTNSWRKKGEINEPIILYGKSKYMDGVKAPFFVGRTYKEYYESLLNRIQIAEIHNTLSPNKATDSLWFLGGLFFEAKGHPFGKDLFSKAQFSTEKDAISAVLLYFINSSSANPDVVSDETGGKAIESHVKTILKRDEKPRVEVLPLKTDKKTEEKSLSRSFGYDKDGFPKSLNGSTYLTKLVGLDEVFLNSENKDFNVDIVECSQTSKWAILKRYEGNSPNTIIAFQNMYEAERAYFEKLKSEGRDVIISKFHTTDQERYYFLYVKGLIKTKNSEPERNQNFILLDKISNPEIKINYNLFFQEFLIHMQLLRDSALPDRSYLNSLHSKGILIVDAQENKFSWGMIKRWFGLEQKQVYQFLILDIMYSDEGEQENDTNHREKIYSEIFRKANLKKKWEKFYNS